MSCELFDHCSIWFGRFLMVQKVGEINLFVRTFVNRVPKITIYEALFEKVAVVF